MIEFFHLSEVGNDTIWEYDRNEFLKSIEKKLVNVKNIFKQQHTDSQEHITSLLPYAIYHGCVFVYKSYWKKCLSLSFLAILTHPKL